MPPRQLQFYAGPLEKELKERTLNTEAYSASAIAQRDLQRYYLLMRRSLPRFTLPEARLLVNALAVSGVYSAEGSPPAWPVDRAPIWAHVTEAIEQEAESQRRIAQHTTEMAALGLERRGDHPDPTFGVDTDALIARLRTFTPCQEMAIFDAVERLNYTETERPVDEESGSGEMEVVTTLPDEELVRVGLARAREDAREGSAWDA